MYTLSYGKRKKEKINNKYDLIEFSNDLDSVHHNIRNNNYQHSLYFFVKCVNKFYKENGVNKDFYCGHFYEDGEYVFKAAFKTNSKKGDFGYIVSESDMKESYIQFNDKYSANAGFHKTLHAKLINAVSFVLANRNEIIKELSDKKNTD